MREIQIKRGVHCLSLSIQAHSDVLYLERNQTFSSSGNRYWERIMRDTDKETRSLTRKHPNGSGLEDADSYYEVVLMPEFYVAHKYSAPPSLCN
jgi:hypothetical protein